MKNEIHVNDVGTRFLITVENNDAIVDISEASTINFIFKKPSDEVFYRVGTFLTDGKDGKTYYDVINGDLNEVGYYKLQLRVYLYTGSFYTDIHTFQVHCNL